MPSPPTRRSTLHRLDTDSTPISSPSSASYTQSPTSYQSTTTPPPTTTRINMMTQRRHSPANSSTPSTIPYIGGAFTQSTSTTSTPQSSSPPSNNNNRPLTGRRQSTRIGGGSSWLFRGGGGGTTKRWTTKKSILRFLSLTLILLSLYWIISTLVPKGMRRGGERARKKLDYRWWDEQDLLDSNPDDLAALLPKPTIIPPLENKKKPTSLSSFQPPQKLHTLSQLLKLPSTSSPTKSDYTTILHLTSSSQLLSSHLSPILESLSRQEPLPPRKVILLCPSGMEPTNTQQYSNKIKMEIDVLSYNPERDVPILKIVETVMSSQDQSKIDTDFLLFVDGHLPTSGGGSGGMVLSKNYVSTLIHAFGTKEYGSSVLSAGGLSISPRTSSSSTSSSRRSPKNDKDDNFDCIYPFYPSSSSSSNANDLGTIQRISIPSTPFLISTNWLLPRSPISSSSSSSSSSKVGSTSPTIFQGIPNLRGLPIAMSLSFGLWTKNGIPSFAVPSPIINGGEDTSSGGGGGGVGGNGEGLGLLDGMVCERFKSNLRSGGEKKVGGRIGQQELERDEGETTMARLKKSFVEMSTSGMRGGGGGEGLRKIRGDKKKGGRVSGVQQSPQIGQGALWRAKEMRKGSFVVLVSGREELEGIRNVACRFANGIDDDDDELFTGGGEDGGDVEGLQRPDRELRIVVTDWDESNDRDWWIRQNQQPSTCHLELIPLSTSSNPDQSISLPLIDLLDVEIDPAPAFVLYVADGPRSREFEEVLKWMGGIFGVKKGGDRLSRVRAEKEAVGTRSMGDDDDEERKSRMTVVGIEKEELVRAEWIGALPIEALRHWHTPRIDVSVITNDRPVSLHRLLTSLQSTQYYGDDVSLSLNLEQTTDRLTHRLVDDFRWPHGPLTLRHRILLGGLMPAIVESWYPASNDTYGVLLEDDVEVSPLFYGWLKFTILRYRYTLQGRIASSRLFGVSLYQQKNIELRPEGRQPFDAHKLFESLSLHSTTPYLSQIPCSWGAAYFPEVWREFHSYLSLRLSELALPISEPIVPAIRSNRWPRSWKKYFIELVYLRGYTMLYPNYPNFESLSTNHLEKGTHVHTSRVEEKKKQLFEVPLLDREGSLVDSLPMGQLPEWQSLPVMDLWGSFASMEELVERGWQTTRQIGSCRDLPSTLISSTTTTTTMRLKYDARELLCKKSWDRELQGRLVQAQPLSERAEEDTTGMDAGMDQGRREAAEEEHRGGGIDDERGRQVRRDEGRAEEVKEDDESEARRKTVRLAGDVDDVGRDSPAEGVWHRVPPVVV